MIKNIPWNAYDFDARRVEQVKIASTGLSGEDFRAFVKRASHPLARWVRDNPPLPGEVYVHNLALGSTERFGCFPPGTEVRDGDADLRAIETINEGDTVVSHTGKPRKVLKTFARDYRGTLYHFDISGQLERPASTPEHPYYVIRREQVACEHDRVVRCTPTACQRLAVCQKIGCPKATVNYHPEWVTAKDVNVGDFVLIPVPGYDVGRQAWRMSASAAKLGGFYLAEGSLIKGQNWKFTDHDYGAVLSFGISEEKTLAADAVRCAEELGAYADVTVSGPHLCREKSTATVSVRSTALAGRLRKYFGSLAGGKFLAGEVYQQPLDVLRTIIGAYIDGDGHMADEDDRYTVASVSRRLLLDLQWLLTRFGVPAALCVGVPADPARNHQTSYQLSFAGQYGDFLAGHCRKYRKAEPLQPKSWAFAWNGYICQPVRSIGTTEYTGTVHNLEVEVDNSYTVGNGIAVHNCNRNADSYPHAMLQRDHPTFEKYAHFFLNHCFVAGTRVVLADRRRVPIETVCAGDRVATAVGPRPVTEIYHNHYEGPVLAFKLEGVPDRVTVTPNHPVYAIRRDVLFTRYGYCRLNPDTVGRNHADWDRPVRAEYVPAGELLAGDYVLIPRPDPGGEEIDPALAELVGWVAADGYVSECGAIGFTFKRERKITAVTDVLARLGLNATRRLRRDGLTALSVNSVKLCEQLSRFVVGSLETKRLTGEVLRLSRDGIQRVLGAYIDGDGNFSKNNPGTLRIRSSSPPMREALTDCIRALGVPCGVQIDNTAGTFRGTGKYAHRVYRSAASGCVTVSRAYTAVVAKYSATYMAVPSKIRIMPMIWGGYQLAKITDRGERHHNGLVYNFKVTGPEHYVAGEIQVHNCNRDPKRSYGRVKKAWYNEDLQRVEVIVALNATKEAAARNGNLVAERTLQKLASGVDVAVSQSCRVKWDECTACGNRARNRSEYCGPAQCVKYGGCRDNLGRTFDDGFYLGVHNPHCTFFDLSDVSDTRGADRTAFLTGKVAATNGRTVGGAELAEMLGLVAPEYLLDPRTVAAAGCLRKLAALGPYPHPTAPNWEMRGDNVKAAVEMPGTDAARHALLGELAAAGVVLPPARWLALATGSPLDKCAAVFAAPLDPARDLLERDDLHDVLEKAAVAGDSRLSPAGKWAHLAPTADAHARESARGVLAPPPAVKTAHVPPAVRAEAAARYLAYQANCLALHQNSADFPLMLSECRRHNRSSTV